MDIARKLAEFHAALGQSFGDDGSGSNKLRKRLHEEEYRELVEAIESGDRVAIAGELADVVYVAYGTAHSLGLNIHELPMGSRQHADMLGSNHARLVKALEAGVRTKCALCLSLLVSSCYSLAEQYEIDLDAVVTEVHTANMRKIGPNGPMLVAGKVMKPEGWYPADVASVLAGEA